MGHRIVFLIKIEAQFILYSDDSWHIFMKRFAASVQHITGQELDVKAVSDSDSIVELELEALRSKVEELSDEVSISARITIKKNLNLITSVQRTKLRNDLNQQIAEVNTLKSLPLGIQAAQTKSSAKPEVIVLYWNYG